MARGLSGGFGLGGRWAVGDRARGSLGGQRTSWVQDLPLSCWFWFWGVERGGEVERRKTVSRRRFFCQWGATRHSKNVSRDSFVYNLSFSFPTSMTLTLRPVVPAGSMGGCCGVGVGGGREAAACVVVVAVDFFFDEPMADAAPPSPPSPCAAAERLVPRPREDGAIVVVMLREQRASV